MVDLQETIKKDKKMDDRWTQYLSNFIKVVLIQFPERFRMIKLNPVISYLFLVLQAIKVSF